MVSIKEKVKLYNLFPKKNFSQNFIYDDQLLSKIADAVDDISSDEVFEIGPGPGTLTEKIFQKKPKKFTLIEIDERFRQILSEVSNEIDVIFADFLKMDIDGIIKEDSVVYSNLPYAISSQIMFKLFDVRPKTMVLLFQKEMASRIIAKIGTKDYGKITVLASLLYDVQKVTDVKPGAFYPVPGVVSTLLKFTRKNDIPDVNFEKLNKLLTISFSTRRKQLKNNLKPLRIEAGSLFERIGLNADIRAEDVSLDQYLMICNEIQGVL